MLSRLVKVAKSEDLPNGQVRGFTADGLRLLLARVEGQLFAMIDICSHENAASPHSRRARSPGGCPRHGTLFEMRTGEVICPPAFEPFPTLPVEVHGEDIFVGLP